MCPILPLPCTYFNSQPHKEADTTREEFKLSVGISTHSLTRRLTIRPLTRMEYRLNFNSQPHKEADYICRPSRDSINISTHSLTRRLTLRERRHSQWKSISTHSLTRRLTRERITRNSRISYFNSQPHKEADVFLPDSSTTICISTHSLTRRLTEKTEVLNTIFNISTHSLTRRLTF